MGSTASGTSGATGATAAPKLTTSDRSPRVLDRDECERQLRHGYTGRVGFVAGGRPQVLPVNYVFADGAVLFRTGRGAKLDAAMREEIVAFEIDGTSVEEHGGWSVLVVGRAHVLGDEEDIAKAGRLPLRPWAYGGDRPFWVRIDPIEITGRSLGIARWPWPL